MRRFFHGTVFFIAVLAVFGVAAFGLMAAHAQQRSEPIRMASTFPVADTGVEQGDIISYNARSDVYILSREVGDSDIFGVVVEQPLMVLRGEEDEVPVVQSGHVPVNVTLRNGPINAGDFITSSPIPGKGQRADPDKEKQYILGVARESFTKSDGFSTTTTTGETVTMGKIDVTLRFGPQNRVRQALQEQREGFGEITMIHVLQYGVAAFVAVGAAYIAFRNFMPNLRRGVISVGRNPRARSSIQSMVILNTVLILVVVAAGFFVALGIIMLPV